jgi:hypothetical protein
MPYTEADLVAEVEHPRRPGERRETLPPISVVKGIELNIA